MMRLLILSFVLMQTVTAPVFAPPRSKSTSRRSTPKWLLGYGARQSTGVHDPIFHRIVAMDDGATKFLLVSTDLCLFSPTVYNEAAERIQKETGIPARALLVERHAHPFRAGGRAAGSVQSAAEGRSEHAVDSEYTERILSSWSMAPRRRVAKLAPARLASGTGIAMANINRRAREYGRQDFARTESGRPGGPADRVDPAGEGGWHSPRR